jgi:putative transposase
VSELLCKGVTSTLGRTAAQGEERQADAHEDLLDTAEVGSPRRDRDEPRLVDPELVDRLIQDAREQGVDVAGEGGLFAQLAKTVMERSLAAELTDHLGYDEDDPARQGTGNTRNGFTPKKLATEVGVLDLEVPRGS